MTFLALFMMETNKSCNPGPGTKINKSLFNNILGISSRYVFSWYPFYFDFHRARIIFDVSSGFYLWNINKTTA